jgi:hypothetical protein
MTWKLLSLSINKLRFYHYRATNYNSQNQLWIAWKKRNIGQTSLDFSQSPRSQDSAAWQCMTCWDLAGWSDRLPVYGPPGLRWRCLPATPWNAFTLCDQSVVQCWCLRKTEAVWQRQIATQMPNKLWERVLVFILDRLIPFSQAFQECLSK